MFGCNGQLAARFACVRGRTVLADAYCTAPLKIAKTFHAADERGHTDGGALVYVQDVSPGLLAGDCYELVIHVEAGARAYLTTVTATKIHPAVNGRGAKQRTHFVIESGGMLVYVPEPTIPFRGARFENETVVHVEADAAVLLTEILAPGRDHSGEAFAYEEVQNRWRVYRDGRLVLYDAMRLGPAVREKEALSRLLLGYRWIGTMLLVASWHPSRQARQRFLSQFADEQVLVGLSLLPDDAGLVCRALAQSPWQLQHVFMKLWRWWSVATGARVIVFRK